MAHTVYIMYSRTCVLESDSVFPDKQNTHLSFEGIPHCVLCIVYSGSNHYSHLKSTLCIWVQLCIVYCVLGTGCPTLSAVTYCVLCIMYCVLHIGWPTLSAVTYYVSVLCIVYWAPHFECGYVLCIVYCVLHIGRPTLSAVTYCVLCIAYCVLSVPL